MRRLPRWVLLLLCMAYVLPGYLGREPWKNEDVASFGVMALMAKGQGDWWFPMVLGVPAETPAWLPYWLGAGFIYFVPGFPEFASRLPFISALVLTLYFTWQAIYRFALLPTAQPVMFAFGGQAHPVDYARALADSGLMALMACLGLAQLAHEAAASTFQMASLSCMLFAAAASIQPIEHLKPKRIALTWILGLLGLGLSGQPALATSISLLWPMAHQWILTRNHASREPDTQAQPRADQIKLHKTLMHVWLIGAVISVTMVALAMHVGMLESPILPRSLSKWRAFGKMLIWFTWPVWPLTFWTLWRWRRHIHQPHMATPLLFTSGITVASLLMGASDRVLLLALPALSVIAAFSLPTLKRSVSALIDWFSVLFFSAAAVIIWVIWIAMMTGIPSKPAANVARLAPGFQPEFGGLTFALATIATFIWLGVVAWRLGRHQSVIWKSMVLPATGSVLSWVLLMTLWLPLLDYGRSYGPMARRMSALIEPGHCVQIHDLSQAQIAGLMHHGRLDLQRQPDQRQCSYLVTRAESAQQNSGFNRSIWTFKARLNRLNDKRESLLLFTLIPKPETNPTDQQSRDEPGRQGTAN